MGLAVEFQDGEQEEVGNIEDKFRRLGSHKTRGGSSWALDKRLPSRIESLCGHMQFSGRLGQASPFRYWTMVEGPGTGLRRVAVD